MQNPHVLEKKKKNHAIFLKKFPIFYLIIHFRVNLIVRSKSLSTLSISFVTPTARLLFQKPNFDTLVTLHSNHPNINHDPTPIPRNSWYLFSHTERWLGLISFWMLEIFINIWFLFSLISATCVSSCKYESFMFSFLSERKNHEKGLLIHVFDVK